MASVAALMIFVSTLVAWPVHFTILQWGEEPQPYRLAVLDWVVSLDRYPPPLVPFRGTLIVQPWDRIVGVPLPLAALPLLLVSGLWIHSYRKTRRRYLNVGCLRCGYNLTGNDSGVCPECGKTVENAQR